MKQLAIHPYLFAVFPTLLYFCLLSLIQTPVDVLLTPLIACVLGTAIIHCLSFLLLRDIRRAAILTTLIVCFFYSITMVIIVLKKIPNPADAVGLSQFALGASWVLIFVGIFYCLFTKGSFTRLTGILNEVSLFLVVVELLIIGAHWTDCDFIKYSKVERAYQSPVQPQRTLAEAKPDLYYIILDKLAHPRILNSIFDYDNKSFVDYLKSKGFYVAERSNCNYPRTLMSLGSSLNMDYLDKAALVYGANSTDLTPFCLMIRNNNVARYLKSIGYKFINLSSAFGPTDWIPEADQNINCGALCEFSTGLLENTILGLFDGAVSWLDEQYRGQKRSTFSKLAELAKTPGPKFVLAHILLPHEPFLFNADGASVDKIYQTVDERWTPETKRAYLAQVKFTEREMKRVIEQIIANSKTCPIIIIQSDHGTDSTGSLYSSRGLSKLGPSDALVKERFPIFNAYLLPGKSGSIVYDTITPVNSFRTILHAYFNFDLPLLADRSYYSPFPKFFKFTDETDFLNGSQTAQVNLSHNCSSTLKPISRQDSGIRQP